MEEVRFCLIEDSDHGFEFSLYDDNQKEEDKKFLSMCFSVYYEGFGGAGEMDSMTFYDLNQLANSARSVLDDEEKLSYYCYENKELSFSFQKEGKDNYLLEANLSVPGSSQMIVVKKNHLSKKEFSSIINPFFIWKDAYLNSDYLLN